jgi:MFS family permease
MSPVVRVTLCLAFGFTVSMFFRGANGVIAPELMAELQIAPARMGLVTGAFFLTFGLAMIPGGLALDRFGPRRTIASLSLLGVLGCVIFATATGWIGLAIGRVVLAVACVCILMGSVATLSRWVKPAELGTYVGYISAAGAVGNMLTATPMALLVQWVGWRGAYWVFASLCVVVSAAIWFGVRDQRSGEPLASTRESPAEVWAGLREVLRFRYLVPFMAAQAVIYPTAVTITGLWVGPYLADIYGLSPTARGNVLLLMTAIGFVGSLVIGRLDGVFNTRKGVVIGLTLLTAASLLPLALWGGAPLWLATLCLCVAIGVAGVISVLHTHVRVSFPERIAGRGLSTINAANMGGAFLLSAATGAIVDQFRGASGAAPPLAYQLVFAFLIAALLVGLLFYRRVPDVRPRP